MILALHTKTLAAPGDSISISKTKSQAGVSLVKTILSRLSKFENMVKKKYNEEDSHDNQPTNFHKNDFNGGRKLKPPRCKMNAAIDNW